MTANRRSTPIRTMGSHILAPAILANCILGCGTGRADQPIPTAVAPGAPAPAANAPAANAPAANAPATNAPATNAPSSETCLGVADRGIWTDLDDDLQLALPAGTSAAHVTATVDVDHHVLVLSIDGWPTKPYPLIGPAELVVGEFRLPLRPGDRAELAPLLSEHGITAATAIADRDHDGIPDTLDAFLGAKKTVLNGDAYIGGYETLSFPMGDVARDHGVCTDVVVRSLRNAGLDLQAALQADIARARRSYPMIRNSHGDSNIDHRRVKTLLPYFRRHFEAHSIRIDDPTDPVRPGDLVLFDTFPSRPGPDHIGIVSDRTSDAGVPLVINNWTDGSVTAEMDLLSWLAVTHRFRITAR